MKPKLLIINIYFAPNSYGGATIVAEELAMHLIDSFDVYVLTSISNQNIPSYNSLRYKAKGIDIIGINLPEHSYRKNTFVNHLFEDEVSKWVELINPNIIHTHCIQNMGAKYFDTIENNKIPHVVTVHDNWWICERQFMINKYGNYCGQEKINFEICNQCMNNIEYENKSINDVKSRFEYLVKQLSKVDVIMFPSEFQKNLYSKNLDIDEKKLIVNKNGVNFPSEKFIKNKKSDTVRFGFVGGIGANKGSEQLLQAFKDIDNMNYELVIVDNTLSLGYSSIEIDETKYNGEITIIPAYTQDTMDDFFSSIDVLLFPSQVKESFGLTVREALIRDIWVISTDNGGGVEDIVHHENGTIIDMDGDFLQLKMAIEEMLNKDFKEFKNAYKERINSYDTQAKQLKDIIFQLME